MEAVKYALELGNDINAVSANGQTALHGAAYYASEILIRFLVEHGANMNATNKLGQTPYYITQGVYHSGSFYVRKEAGELLRQFGADISIGASMKHTDQIGR